MPKLYTGAEIVFKCLEDQGVEHIFGYPGGAVLPIYDELKNHSSIKHILVRHEQGAGHAAEGYARSSGKPGVVLVTSGPGSNKCCYSIDRCLYGLCSSCLYFWSSSNSFNWNRCISGM
jgi:glyoxylate carboligase